jgi:hypothetical protein
MSRVDAQNEKGYISIMTTNQGSRHTEELLSAELIILHYQRLAEMKSDPRLRISHAELKQELAKRIDEPKHNTPQP